MQKLYKKFNKIIKKFNKNNNNQIIYMSMINNFLSVVNNIYFMILIIFNNFSFRYQIMFYIKLYKIENQLLRILQNLMKN